MPRFHAVERPAGTGVNTNERLTFYLPHWLNREVRIAADAAGQPVSTFITRVLQAALGKEGPKRGAK